jgi:hypothetical protein
LTRLARAGTFQGVRCVTFAVLVLALISTRAAPAQVVVAWNEGITANGAVRAMRSRRPGSALAPRPIAGTDLVLANAPRGRLVVLSRGAGIITVLDRRSWRVRRTIDLGAQSQAEDLAVTAPCRAYVSRRGSAALLRVDLCTGATAEATDLARFADVDGNPDLGALTAHEGRLFVQVRRVNEKLAERFVPPAMLAVVDLASEQLVDVDPAREGAQAIELAGTAPKHRMQVVPATRQLFVSATGGVFDAGGLEVIDLDTLRSEGLVIREADGLTGADLGPFVMVTPERGYLVFTTDLDLSSHLVRFSLAKGVEPGLERYVTVGYAMPAIVHDPLIGTLFVPDGAFGRQGVYVFDAASGLRLTTDPIPTSGQPTDLLLLRQPPVQ